MADEEIHGEGGQPEDRPDYLVGNFQDAEEQARAYRDAEQRMTRATQEAADAARERDEAIAYAEAMAEQMEQYDQQPQPQQQQGYDPSTDPFVARYQQAIEDADAQSLMAMNIHLTQQMIESKLAESQGNQDTGPDPAQVQMFAIMVDDQARKQYENKYGESWDDIKEGVADFLQANTDLIPDEMNTGQAVSRLMMAADFVKSQRLMSDVQQTGNFQAAQRQRQMLAQTLTGGGNIPSNPDRDKEDWDRIMNADSRSYENVRRSS